MGKELFDDVQSKIGDLLSDVKNGKVGLPDLQRPFVWEDNKARNLLDSMLKGYPLVTLCSGGLQKIMRQ